LPLAPPPNQPAFSVKAITSASSNSALPPSVAIYACIWLSGASPPTLSLMQLASGTDIDMIINRTNAKIFGYLNIYLLDINLS
jgi:hypothetical protein